jgi:PAS domain S-box-containing protein
VPGKKRDLEDARRIGERLKLYRQLSSLTQAEAATRIGVTKEHVSVLERGHCYPSLEVLSRAAEVYGTGLANFFLFPPEEEPQNVGRPAALLPRSIRLVTGCGVWTIEFSPRADAWTRDLCRLLGYPPRTKPSLDTFLERIHPEDQTRVNRFMQKVLARQRPLPISCKAVCKDGITRHLLIQADQLEDEFEPRDMARLMILDVTAWSQFRDHLIRDKDRLEALVEERTKDLRQSEKMFKAVAEDTPAMICRYTPGCIITYANTVLCRYFGKTCAALVGTCFLDLMPKEARPPFLASLAMLTPDNPTVLTEHQVRDAHGRMRWHRWIDRAIFDARGQAVAYQGVGEDITEQKQTQEALRASEEQFRAMFDQAPVGILIHDKDTGEILDANPAALAMHGLTDLRELETRDFWYIPPYSFAEALNWIRKAATEGPQEFEWVSRRLEEGIFWEQVRLIRTPIAGTERVMAVTIDVTARKQMEAALCQREQLYRSIFDRSPIAIELYDTSGRLVDVNPACLAMFGVQDVSELQGFDLFADPNLNAADIELLKQGKTACFETDFDFEKVRRHNLYQTSKTGTIWLRALITPLGETGAHGYLAQVQDITERKKAREHLLDQRSRLVNILKGTNVGTWEWNVQTGETVFNERWAEIVGYDLEELAPISITTWMELAHPGDLGTCEALLQRHFRGEIDFYECEARMRHKDGHWVWVLDRGRVITWTEDGKPLWMFGTHQDITRRKPAEARKPDHEGGTTPHHPLKLHQMQNEKASARENNMDHVQLFENAPVGFFQATPEGRFLSVNPECARMAGFESCQAMTEQVTDMANQWFVHPEQSEHYLQCLRDTGRIKNFEAQLHRPDGIPFWASMSTTIMADADGNRFQQGFLLDITPLRQAENELAQAKVAAQSAHRAKREFLNNMSHELRTPFSGIQGMLELLLESPLNAAQNEHATIALRASERFTRLLADILTISGIETGKACSSDEEFNPHELSASVLGLFVVEAREKGLEIESRIDPSLPLTLFGDAPRIRQVLFHLVANAVKFTSQGGILLKAVPLFPSMNGEMNVRFTVSDTGEGMPEGKIDEICLPFVQLDGSFARRHQGAGLGLAIVQRLVDQMGGMLDIQSKPGSGAVVHVDLSCRVPDGSGCAAGLPE